MLHSNFGDENRTLSQISEMEFCPQLVLVHQTIFDWTTTTGLVQVHVVTVHGVGIIHTLLNVLQATSAACLTDSYNTD